MLHRQLFVTNPLLRRKGDRREPSTYATARLTSENVSATTYVGVGGGEVHKNQILVLVLSELQDLAVEER
jgi:hypothetical protein